MEEKGDFFFLVFWDDNGKGMVEALVHFHYSGTIGRKGMNKRRSHFFKSSGTTHIFYLPVSSSLLKPGIFAQFTF